MDFDSVLFLCVANSARSQMAEALARARFGDSVRVQSAGSVPSRVNPYAVRALAELGIDSEDLHSKHVDTVDPKAVDLVIMLCAEESCPVFLGDARRLNWAMPDPDRKDEELSDATRLAHFRTARDAIARRIDVLAGLREMGPAPAPTQHVLTVSTPGRGFTLLNAQLETLVAQAQVQTGLCHVFLLHTSASLVVQENADPDVRADLEDWMARHVPDGDPRYRHDAEGPDDMPAHIRAALTATSLTLPIRGGRLLLGTWQGVYLYEHRTRPHTRRLAVTILGA